jgi:hypothetical protein
VPYKIKVDCHADGYDVTVPAFPEISNARAFKTFAEAQEDGLNRIPFAIEARKARGVSVPEEDD